MQTSRTFRYGRSYVRWALWIGSLVIGHGVGLALYLTVHSGLARAAVTCFGKSFFVYAFITYIVIAIVMAPLIASLPALLGLLHTKPVSLSVGILIALVVGILLGIASSGEITSSLRLYQCGVP